MMTDPVRIAGAAVALVFAFATSSFGHEGHQHAPPELASVSGHGDTYEATLSYPEFHAGEEVDATLYLADWSTNEPVNDATVSLEIVGDDLERMIKAEASDGAGVYTVHFKLPTEAAYSVLIDVKTEDDFDLFSISDLQVTHDHGEETDGGTPLAAFPRMNQRAMLFLALAGGVVLALGGYALGRRQGRNPSEVTEQ